MSGVWIARPLSPKNDANAPGLDRHTGRADAAQLKPACERCDLRNQSRDGRQIE